MSSLRFASPQLGALSARLLEHCEVESCGIGYAHHDPDSGSWVVAEVAPVPDDAYETRDRTSATLRPQFLVGVANRSRVTGMAVVVIHTHPDALGHPHFSPVDDAGEAELEPYFGRRAAPATHLAMVIGRDGCRARHLGGDQEVEVWEVGERLDLHSEWPGGAVEDRHDRQMRAFGEPGQRMLRRLHVGVVGAGGTGSLACQQLAHLGVERATVIDPDAVERTNLNRLVGSDPDDVDTPKVDVARRMMLAINPAADITALRADIVDEEVAALLPSFDLVMLCTDSHASRAVVNQAAYQHLVPAIDMGVGITVGEADVTHITGRVQMLAPGLPCLTCCGALDAEQIRRELQTPEQRGADPYVHGVREPQPAVISINATVTSLAVTMLLAAVTTVPSKPRHLGYDGIRGRVKEMAAEKHPRCVVCSPAGALTKGGSWPAPVRVRGRKGEAS